MEGMDERNSIISHEGYKYKKKSRNARNGVMYYVCVQDRKIGCGARGKVEDGEFRILTAIHNHAREDDQIAARAFKDQLRDSCRRERGNLKNIYDIIAARNPEGAVFVPYNSIRSSMRRWRQATTPNIPATLEDLGQILQTGSVVADGHMAVIFGNQQFIANFRDSQYTFIDGTFKAVPRRPNFSQILTIFATAMDHAFPLVHVFMERKTKSLYDAVFLYIRNIFPNFVTNTIVTDYEVALVESLRGEYPQASLHGCFFHFCQAILRKAKMIGLVRQIEGNAEARRLLRKYYSLALLPEHMIVEALNYLWDNNRELNNTFRELHEYVRRQWIGHVTPQHFSVFRQRHRTNNVMESYHRRLNSKLVRHPGIWDLMETLIGIQNTAAIELAQLEQQGRVFRVANKNIVFNARLFEAWDKVTDGRFTIGDFLRQSVHFVEGLDRNLYQWNENIPDAEVPPAGPPDPPPAVHPDPAQAPNAPPNPQIVPPQPPPLIYFHAVPLAQPPPLFPVQLPVHNVPPPLPQIHPLPVQNEPPPLFFLNAEPPVFPANEHIPIEPNEDNEAPLINEPLSPQLAELPELELDFPPLPPEPPSPGPPTPPINFNFPAIPIEIERLFRQLGDNEDEDDEAQNVVERRWEPDIPETEFDDATMAQVLRCVVCYLNKTQYVVTCGHAFCSSCVNILFNNENPRCAVCREPIMTVPQKLFLV